MDIIQTTLNYCIESARRGESKINVFDLMYETGLAYSDLQPALAALIERKELVQSDIKTFEFIGDKNRDVNAPTVINPPPVINPPQLSSAELDERRAALEARRQEIMRRMQMEEHADCTEQNNAQDVDDDYIKALKCCIEENIASVSMLQRRFPIGYIKSCKIIDWMEKMKYISEARGNQPRKILITKEEFDSTYGDGEDELDLFDLAEMLEEDDEESFAEELTKNLNGMFSWENTERGIIIRAQGLKFSTGESVQFRLFNDGDGTMLTDDGFAKGALMDRDYYNYSRANSKINKFIQGKRIEYAFGELRLQTDLSTAITDFMYLYWAVESLI